MPNTLAELTKKIAQLNGREPMRSFNSPAEALSSAHDDAERERVASIEAERQGNSLTRSRHSSACNNFCTRWCRTIRDTRSSAAPNETAKSCAVCVSFGAGISTLATAARFAMKSPGTAGT